MTDQNRGQTPNDPHPIGVSVRLIPKVAEPKPEEILPEFPMREQEYYSIMSMEIYIKVRVAAIKRKANKARKLS